ncbi:MAG: lipoyl domain-containing protein [Proteobacteria bacterium]|nr:lipoyl domain-containing protein [Pseudomonadota bacterium]MBU1902632.1 lipoyl domain-containing protein [Pseudomonadota bacterium]
MDYDIVVPPTADGSAEVKIVSWLKEIGNPVRKGEDLAEATTEKITLYVTAPADGTLKEILVQAGEKARVNDVIGVMTGVEEG